MDPEIEAVRELEDPLKQAQQASELLTREYRKGFEVPKSFPTKETSQASKGV